MDQELEGKVKEDMLDSIKSRQIVQEIMNFGVNDFQIKKIIKFLALELENRDTMLKIYGALEEEPESQIEL